MTMIMRKLYSFLFAALAVVAIAQVFVASEKDIEVPEKPIQRPETSHILMTTYKNVGEEVVLHYSQGGIVGLPPVLIGAEKAWQYDLEGNLPRNLKYKLTSKTVIIQGEIKYLKCAEAGLTTLDVGECEALERLICNSNALMQMSFPNNPNLKELNCARNNLTELDLSKLPALEILNCGSCLINELDLSHNTKLKSFSCSTPNGRPSQYQLASLNVQGCSELEHLDCYNNNLLSLDCSGLSKLKEFNCHQTKLASLNLEGCTSLETLWCYQTQLTSLDLSDCVNLKSLKVYRDNITGEALSAMVKSMPDRTGREAGSFLAYLGNTAEENELTEEDRAILASKNWEVKPAGWVGSVSGNQ